MNVCSLIKTVYENTPVGKLSTVSRTIYVDNLYVNATGLPAMTRDQKTRRRYTARRAPCVRNHNQRGISVSKTVGSGCILSRTAPESDGKGQPSTKHVIVSKSAAVRFSAEITRTRAPAFMRSVVAAVMCSVELSSSMSISACIVWGSP